MNDDNTLYINALEIFGIDKNVDVDDITNTNSHTSDQYALGPILTFDYKNNHYYLVFDYSLGDNPSYVKDILIDINHLLKGSIVQKPSGSETNAKYAAIIDGEECYLWKSPLLT